MRSYPATWKHFVFYGEVVGFALAWVVGLVVLARSEAPEPRLAGANGLANAEIGLHDSHTSGEKLK